jgi:hypothetical protein
MKNLLRTTNLFFMFLMLAIAFVSCVKKDDFYKKNSDESSRKQVVQIIGADDIIQYSRDVKSTNDTFVLIDIRRYPNNEAGLNQPLTVKLVKNATLIADYNATNGTSLIELPTNSYTLLTDINNITFEAGEAIKEIKISINQSLLDLTEAYAIGFSIADAGTDAVINTSLKNALYSIGIKNAYEAYYATSGYVFHPSAPRALDDTKYLYTVSGTRCLAPLADLYGSGYYFWFDVSGTNTLTNWDCTPVAPPSSGFFTADNPGAIGYPGPELPGTAPYLQTTYNNTYNPGTQTFWMHYGYGVGSTSQNGWTRNFYEKWVRQ